MEPVPVTFPDIQKDQSQSTASSDKPGGPDHLGSSSYESPKATFSVDYSEKEDKTEFVKYFFQKMKQKANLSTNEKYNKNVQDLKTYLKNKKAAYEDTYKDMPKLEAPSGEESDDSFDKAWNSSSNHTLSYQMAQNEISKKLSGKVISESLQGMSQMGVFSSAQDCDELVDLSKILYNKPKPIFWQTQSYLDSFLKSVVYWDSTNLS